MAEYFSDTEVKGLDQNLVIFLDAAREFAGVPFKITSGLRTGTGTSAHYKGLAVDIACSTSRERFQILEGLFWAGFTRIGIYDRHIHADLDLKKDEYVAWLGVSS